MISVNILKILNEYIYAINNHHGNIVVGNIINYMHDYT